MRDSFASVGKVAIDFAIRCENTERVISRVGRVTRRVRRKGTIFTTALVDYDCECGDDSSCDDSDGGGDGGGDDSGGGGGGDGVSDETGRWW